MKVMKNGSLFLSLIVLMRILFGVGWLLAGVTKITEKSWFTEPGVFLKDYLLKSLENPDAPTFYKIFIENFALEYVTVLNYLIPIVQILLGIFLIAGLFTIPSILVCLLMHINFILSGNMNVMSLVLYTSAFSLLIFRANVFYFSLDKYFNLRTQLSFNRIKTEQGISMPSNKKNIPINS